MPEPTSPARPTGAGADRVAALQAQYSSYPFPYTLAVHLPAWLPRGVRRWLARPKGARYARYLAELVPPERRGRLLDAGCGTGEILTAIATSQRWERIVAIDLTPRSLDVARRYAALEGADVEFRQANLMDASTLPVDRAPFDAITSFGVLHHLPDPATGLRHLVELLAPDGLMLLYLYATAGRDELLRRRELLRLLVPDEADLDAKLALARELGWTGPPIGGLRGLALRALGVSLEAQAASKAIDDVANVQERSYTARELRDLVEGAGLEPVRWFRGLPNQSAEALPPAVAARVHRLSPDQRDRVHELHAAPFAFVVGLRRKA